MHIYSQTLFFILVLISCVLCENKYSKSANEKKKSDVDFRNLDKPFRMNKLNLLWTKARQRLTEPKLKSLYSDLMIQDKEELIQKRVKSEGGDKEGLKEAELRRKLSNIMSNYGLLHHFEPEAARGKDHPAFNSAMDDYINKSIFKDKKLNYLWTKAESAGFTMEELMALREEFTHHQEKIDQYYDLFSDDSPKNDAFRNVINEDELDKFNEIGGDQATEANKDYIDKANLIREKHQVLRDGYDRIQRVIAKGTYYICMYFQLLLTTMVVITAKILLPSLTVSSFKTWPICFCISMSLRDVL
ncbi:unnamed protein product [Chrysodeixis includens]|uniref:Alpha-2-macroglobulin receptor-associated protein n=1 Tax=Chrysodeixis includens TaxID=689277 RepID=A0A9N8KX63_CHRIL|nr:unnamed protein product [Chrysodeixis includens]